MNRDEEFMALAIEAGASARHRSSPNPWVGAVLVSADGSVATGATQAPGGDHAEIVALANSADPVGATLYSTLEPCNHEGRTGPCAETLIAARVARVVVGIEDPDPLVSGSGVAALRAAGIEVVVGVGSDAVTRQLRPYIVHRRSGRPWVMLKLASTIDGRAAAPDGTSQWITSAEARRDVHRLRAESDVILVGAGTVRSDDPSLTVRDWPTAALEVDPEEVVSPKRVVLGSAPADAKIQPCLQWLEGIPELLDHLGSQGAVQLMVEGGPTVAASFHSSGLVDQYVIYLAPALFGGDDAVGVFAGQGAPTIADVWRGQIDEVTRLGDDVRIDIINNHVDGA